MGSENLNSRIYESLKGERRCDYPKTQIRRPIRFRSSDTLTARSNTMSVVGSDDPQEMR